MELPTPRLDDRGFDDLMREAKEIARARCKPWSDLEPGDPGLTLLELFAFLTDTLLYRVNRIPLKVHVALLNLLGVAPKPPAAATVGLTFTRTLDLDAPMRLPTGTAVADKSGTIVFHTLGDVDFAVGAETGDAQAIHAELVSGELIGIGTGEMLQSAKLRRAPLLRGSETREDIVIGVEADPAETGGQGQTRNFGGRSFIVWQEVAEFRGLVTGTRAFRLDRSLGTVTFAPPRSGTTEQQPAVPGRDREIRAWYWVGGGKIGNLKPNTLTVLKAPVNGVTVTNPAAAGGGEDAEPIEAAMARARESAFSIETAVTARDFERIAIDVGGIARTSAYARRQRWAFGEPGVVEVQLVPAIANAERPGGLVTLPLLEARQTADLLARVEAALIRRRPIGVGTMPVWMRYRPVTVEVSVTVVDGEDPNAVRDRILASLGDLLSPCEARPLERMLRASDVYDRILAVPGVQYADQLRLTIKDAPDGTVNDLVRDPLQARLRFVATDKGLYRSVDRARSWTRQDGAIPDQQFRLVRTSQERVGLVAAVSTDAARKLATIWVSQDSGDSWEQAERLQGEEIHDIAWIARDGRPILLLATRVALRRLDIGSGHGSEMLARLQPGTGEPERTGFYALASIRHPSGVLLTAVASRSRGGVLISNDGSLPGTYTMLPGLADNDVRVLRFQRDGDRVQLLAGLSASAGAEGGGIMRIEARADGPDPTGWISFGKGWTGGSCEAIDTVAGLVVAGTNRGGVLVLDPPRADTTWRRPPIDCGLPITPARNTLLPVTAVLAAATDDPGGLLAGTEQGLFTSEDTLRFNPTGRANFTDRVPLPPYQLYCSGDHRVTVRRNHDAEED